MMMKPQGKFIMWTDSGNASSVELAFKNHMRINSCAPPMAHLFAFESSTGSFPAMCKTWFMLCNEIWHAQDLGPMYGHSFRVGSTTHLLLLGVDPFIVMVQGRLKSSAFLEYWQNCEEIIPTFIGFSLNSKSSVISGMATFKQQFIMWI